MKRILIFLLVIIPVLLHIPLSIYSESIEATNNKAVSIDSSIVGSMGLSLMNSGTDNRVIACFDVNNNGWYAIGYNNNQVHIYDDTGEYQYGYSFHCNGDYGINFSGNNLEIYLVRGDIIATYDPSGNCILVQETLFDDYITKEIIYRTSKQIGKTQYNLERDIGIFSRSYARLVSIDEQGVKKILYDATIAGYIIGSLHYIFLAGFAICVVWVVVGRARKSWYGDD